MYYCIVHNKDENAYALCCSEKKDFKPTVLWLYTHGGIQNKRYRDLVAILQSIKEQLKELS